MHFFQIAYGRSNMADIEASFLLISESSFHKTFIVYKRSPKFMNNSIKWLVHVQKGEKEEAP